MKTAGFVTFLTSNSKPGTWNDCFMSTATVTSPPAASRPAEPIPGVVPAELKEATIMTVWPSVAAHPLGRALGRGFAIRWPDIYFFRLGNLLALLSIPIVLPLYFLKILPFIGTRYTVTNRRIVVLRGIVGKEEKAVDLDRFDTVEVVVQPGQAWYHAGDLVFKKGTVETFRLDGVSRPEAFRHVCVKAQMAHATVKKARQQRRA